MVTRHAGDAYSRFLDQSVTPFDFGDSGYAVCTNIGGEILEVTAPSELCGYVSVKGGFEDSMDSLLSRAQRPFGEKATFSIKIVGQKRSISACRLGSVKERGCLNHRWPLIKYWLETDGDDVLAHDGTCTFFSCIKEGTVYQVMHLELFSTPMDVSSGVAIQPCGDSYGCHPRGADVVVSIGGPVRFSCRCSGLHQTTPRVSWDGRESQKCRKLESDSLPGAVFVMKLFIDGEPIDMPLSVEQPPTAANEIGADTPWKARIRERQSMYGNMAYRKTVPIRSDKPTTIVAAFKLFNHTPSGDHEISHPSAKMMYRLAGIDPDSDYASNSMWKALFNNHVLVDTDVKPSLYYAPELGLIQRCLERVLSAHYIPLGGGADEYGVNMWPHVPGASVSIRQLL